MIRKLIVTVALLASSAAAFSQTAPYLYGRQNAYTFPYSMIGRVEFLKNGSPFIGSGTVITAKGVLTCAHVLYHPNAGWSSDVRFIRGKYGNKSLQNSRPKSLYILGGYSGNSSTYGTRDSRTYQYDLGGMIFQGFPGNRGYTGWGENPGALTSGAVYKQAFGYGAEEHSGKHLLKLEIYGSYFQARGGYYRITTAHSEGGMSGGPVMTQYSDGSFRPIGVNVSGNNDASDFYHSGMRAIDDQAVDLIRDNFP